MEGLLVPATTAFAIAYVASNTAAFLGASVVAQATIAAAAAALTPTVLAIGLSIAANFAASALLGGKPRVPSIKASDGQQSIRQAVTERRKSYGKVQTGGAVWWFDSADGYFYMGLALNHGEIDSIVGYFLEDTEVTVSGNDVTSEPYFKDGNHYVRIFTRLGLSTESKYTQINTAFGVDDVRGDGMATALIVSEGPPSESFREIFPTGAPPQFRMRYRATKCFDPREAGHDNDDASTWEWTNNPVLCLLDYMKSEDGHRIPYSRILPNIAEWKAAADICDEAINLNAGGTEERYRMGGTYALTQDPKDTLQSFLSTFDGWVYQKFDGSIGIKAGKYSTPTVTVPDSAILGHEMRRGRDPMYAVNEVQALYTSPSHDYQDQDADPWRDALAISQDGEVRPLRIELPWVQSHTQCRRLMKRQYLRASAEWTGTIVTDMYGLLAAEERYIYVTIEELGIDSESFEITSYSFNPANMTVEIGISSLTSAIDVWDPATEEGTPPGASVGYTDSGISAPTDVGTSILYNSSIDGVYAVISWDSAWSSATYEAQYKRNSDTAWTSIGVSTGQTSAVTGILDEGAVYNFHVRAFAPGGTASDFTNGADATATVDASAPAVPTSVSVSKTAADEATVQWTAPSSSNYNRGFVYRNTANDFATSDQIGSTFGSPSGAYQYVDSGLVDTEMDTDGTPYYYWVTAANGSDVQSADVAATGNPVNIT